MFNLSFILGGVLGDIIIPNEQNSGHEWEDNIKHDKKDLELLKQQVYNEGLQVEEEGLTDIIRKKTKLPNTGEKTVLLSF